MRMCWKLMLAGVVLLGSMTDLSMASPAAKAGTLHDQAAAKAGDYCTKYLCQKCYNGCWYTVYVCNDYDQAMGWYNAQSGNARVVAQK